VVPHPLADMKLFHPPLAAPHLIPAYFPAFPQRRQYSPQPASQEASSLRHLMPQSLAAAVASRCTALLIKVAWLTCQGPLSCCIMCAAVHQHIGRISL
jgi:hypothetical protein